jgi:hypothetical protein
MDLFGKSMKLDDFDTRSIPRKLRAYAIDRAIDQNRIYLLTLMFTKEDE